MEDSELFFLFTQEMSIIKSPASQNIFKGFLYYDFKSYNPHLPPNNIIDRIQTHTRTLKVFLLRIIERFATAIYFVYQKTFKRRRF